MISAVFSNPKNKRLAKVLMILLFVAVFFPVKLARAAADPCLAAFAANEMYTEESNFAAAADELSSIGASSVQAIGIDMTSQALEDKCSSLASMAASIPCAIIPAGTSGVLNCQMRDQCLEGIKASCERQSAIAGAKVNASKIINNTKLRDKVREVLSFAFKSALKQFSTQVAHDTAVWVASGGRGQQPLFITEGWGSYLKSTADSALGDFIDGIGTQYGVNLCQPDFRVKLMIQTSLNYKQKAKQTGCSFSTIMSNWETAISSATFAVDYRNAMRPGANDISFMLLMADQRNSYVADAVDTATKEAQTTDLWKNITNAAGVILTPGTVVANTFRDKTADSNTTLGMSTFTNTAADMVEEFGNTLVSQLLNNLQGGLFGSGGSTGKSNSNLLPDPETLANLFNFNSSPLVAGTIGAQEKYLSLITNKEKVGNRYDLLLKLATCPDSSKSNPGPTDCVIDNELSTQIRKRIYVKDLPSDPKGSNVLGRAFAPQINQQNSLENEIPYRSILILRKYRIVPVGWEIAANLIKNGQVVNVGGQVNNNNWTLGAVMNCYYGSGVNNCQTDSFKGLVDPYWVLKSYEAFCRREGFGAHNTEALSQDNSISRDEYCSDEQQCLADDSKGNCKAYGYCSEERRLWDLGTTCDARYNTCQTYASRSGASGSLLKNSLDFSNCSALNVGCQAFTGNFNLASAIWNGEFLDSNNNLKIYGPSPSGETIAVVDDPSWLVPQYKNVSINYRLKITQACSKELCSGVNNKCEWRDDKKACDFSRVAMNACFVQPKGISCLVESCFEQANLISAMNNGFELGTAGDATNWTDELSYLNQNNRHYRAVGQGHTGTASLLAFSGNNQVALTSRLENIALDKANANYTLKFWAKGILTSGVVRVNVISGSGSGLENLAGSGYIFSSNLGEWKEYTLQFSSKGHATGTIEIVTELGTTGAVYFDDFKIQKMTTDCQKSSSIMLFTAPVSAPVNNTNIYLDRDASSCSNQDDGCSLLLRNKANVGGNLIYNGGFEHGLGDWNPAWISNAYGGVTISGVDNSDKTVAIDGGSYYSMAFDAAQSAAGGSAQANITIRDINVLAADTNCVSDGGNLKLNIIPTGIDFERAACWFKVPSGVKSVKYTVNGNGSLNIDNLKLEKVSLNSLAGTAYTAYDPSARASNQVSYLKKAPDYFNCYKTAAGLWPETDAELISVLQNQNEMCATYSGVCTKKEVGCESYTPVTGDPVIPGVVDDLDLCPSECVGYQVYKQEATFFATSTFKQFIADNKAKSCSAAYAGCDEFTNLDEVGQGAEKREYYVEFRVCQKPAIDDASYYTWEGSDTTGYQLKSFTFKKSNRDSAPCTNLYYYSTSSQQAGQNYCADDGVTGVCSQNEMVSNPDCREFYDVNGGVSYRLLSKTITVSDNCHPYRRTQTQTTLAQVQADCVASHGYFNTNSECIYMAIPSEGKTCNLQAKGCRSYTGNRGNNIRNVIEVEDFNSGTNIDDMWFDGANRKDGLKISTESTFPGGNSLSNKSGNNVIQRQVNLTKGKTYILSFWAKGNNSYYLSDIKFGSAPNVSDYFSTSRVAGDTLLTKRIQITSDWHYYELGPVFVSWDPNDQDYLRFELNGQIVYLDNVILKEINNNVYLIENSWYTPVSCDNRMDDADGKRAISAGTCQDQSSGRCSVGEMVGCQAYKDRFSNPWYLRSFSSLCRAEAVGCEALIDTKNSESRLAQTFNAGADVGTYDADVVTVPADETVYMVNDAQYSCQASAKGCQAVGLPGIDRWDDTVGYATLFLKNDPDQYDTLMCKHNELWCEQYTTNDSVTYFKDPHGKVCQYGQPNASTSIGWYKAGTTIPCQTTNSQTFGTGYDILSDKLQPIGPVSNFYPETDVDKKTIWSGACPTNQSGCTEFIDPLPFMYTNEVPEVNCPKAGGCQNVKLKANTLYAYQLENNAPLEIRPNNPAECTVFTYDFGKQIQTAGGVGLKYFYINKDVDGYCLVSLTKDYPGTSNVFDFRKDIRKNGNNATGDKIVIAGVYYGLKNQVDKSSCGGQVDFNDSCVLFNDRSQIDYSIIPSDAANTIDANADFKKRNSLYLTYDSVATLNKNIGLNQVPTKVSPVLNTIAGDSSVILKVSPNRACKNWLSCTTYEKGNAKDPNPYFSVSDKCLALENCQYLDANGQCGDYYQSDSAEVVSSSTVFANYTGYSSPDNRNFAAMTQYGESTQVINGNFENSFGDTGEPTGWIRAQYNTATDNPNVISYPWEPRLYKITSEAIGRQGEAKEGTSYLKLNGSAAVISEPAEILPGQKYILSGWVNTENLSGKGVTFADIQVRFLNVNNVPTTADIVVTGKSSGGSVVSNDGKWWYQTGNYSDLVAQNQNIIRVPAGKSWTEFKFEFQNNSDEAMSLEIALMNMDGGLADEEPYKNTGLGGYTAWDAIDVKPVLQPNADEIIQRSCRLYPSADSPSCQYSGGTGQNYYGQYGYCMMTDPKNEKQCLQWWPVDTIKGDTVSDFSGYYKERTPLYYCLEKQTIPIDYGTMMGRLGVYGQGADNSGFSNWKLDRNGEQVQVSGFDIPNGWGPLFRYPHVYKFSFVGAFFTIGSTASKTMFFSFVNATLWPNAVCHGIIPQIGKLFGQNIVNGAGCHILKQTDEDRGTPPRPSTADNAYVCESDEDVICSTATECSDGNRYDKVCDGTIGDGDVCRSSAKCKKPDGNFWENIGVGLANMWDKTVTFLDGVSGYLLGTAVSNLAFNDDDRWGGFGAVAVAIPIPFGKSINFIPWVGMPWHVAQNFDNSVLSSALMGVSVLGVKPSTLGLKIITDEDSSLSVGSGLTDLHPQKGDILGYGFFWKTAGLSGAGDKTGFATLGGTLNAKSKIEYCSKVVRVVTSAGQNKAWSAKLSSGSSYQVDANDCITDSDYTPKDNEPAKRCFYKSEYCLAKKIAGNEAGYSYNLCGNYVGRSESAKNPINQFTLSCVTNSTEVNEDNNGVKKINKNYYCDSGNIYSLIYAYNYYNYVTDYKPYGSLMPPTTGQYPTDWDTRPATTGKQPLFYETPLGIAPYQARMGQEYTVENLKKLFSKSYGYWEFVGGIGNNGQSYGYYVNKTNSTITADRDNQWTLPDYCSAGQLNADGTRKTDAFCKIRPLFTSSTITNVDNRTIRLAFSVKVDSEQLPITGFTVDWGDGQSISYAGVSLVNHPDPSNPFILYHAYEYSSLQAKGTNNCTTSTVGLRCSNIPVVTTVYDNWQASGAITTTISTINFSQ